MDRPSGFRRRVDQVLRVAGEHVGRASIGIISLVLILGTPTAGFLAAFCLAWWIAEATYWSMWLVFVIWFAMSFFLSVYVWAPHVWPAISRALNQMRRIEPPPIPRRRERSVRLAGNG